MAQRCRLFALMLLATSINVAHGARMDRAKLKAHLAQPGQKVRLKITKTATGAFRTTIIRGSAKRLEKLFKKLTRDDTRVFKVHGPKWGDPVLHPVLGELKVSGLGPNRVHRPIVYEVQFTEAERVGNKISRIVIRTERFLPAVPNDVGQSAVRGSIFFAKGSLKFSLSDDAKTLVGETMLRVLSPAEVGAVVEAAVLLKNWQKRQAGGLAGARAQTAPEEVAVAELIGKDGLFATDATERLAVAFRSGQHPWVRPGLEADSWMASAGRLIEFAIDRKIAINPLALARMYSDAAAGGGIESPLRERIMNEFPLE